MNRFLYSILVISGWLIVGVILLVTTTATFKLAMQDQVDPYDKLLDFSSNPSWRQAREVWSGPTVAAMRFLPVNKFGPMLRSKDAFKEFSLNFAVHNPHNCGIVFDYEDEGNFKFLYFRKIESRIVLGLNKDTKPHIVETVPFELIEDEVLTLKRKGGKLSLFKGDEEVFTSDIIDQAGKFGFIINELNDPPVSFRHLEFIGKKEGGGVLSVNEVSEDVVRLSFKVMLAFMSFVLMFFHVGILIPLLRSYGQTKQFILDWLQSFTTNPLYVILCSVLGYIVFSRIVQISELWEGKYLDQWMLWKSLLITVSGYLLVYVLAMFYSKWLKAFSPMMFFVSFLFLFYMFTLINLITFKLDDMLFIRLMYFLLSMPIVYQVFTKPAFRNTLTEPVKTSPFQMQDLLVFLWAVFAVVYTFQYNFTPYRFPFVDEVSLWFTSARNMLDIGILKASLANYPGGNLHSFGVPFVFALPAKLIGQSLVHTLFFAPFAMLIPMFFFLKTIKQNKWLLLTFLAGIYVLFNFNYAGHLFYRSMYGEAICSMFFLFVLYELTKLIKATEVKPVMFSVFCLMLGLMALSKSPTGYFNSVCLLILLGTCLKKVNTYRWVSLGIGLVLFNLPLMTWKGFYFIHKGPWSSAGLALKSADFANVNTVMLGKMFTHFQTYYADVAICLMVMFILALLFLPKWEKLCLVPIVLWVSFVIYYYGFIYRGEDYISSERYLLPLTLALIYLGSAGLNHFIKTGTDTRGQSTA